MKESRKNRICKRYTRVAFIILKITMFRLRVDNFITSTFKYKDGRTYVLKLYKEKLNEDTVSEANLIDFCEWIDEQGCFDGNNEELVKAYVLHKNQLGTSDN